MIAQDFIIKRIDELVEKIPSIQCRYMFDSFSDAHYIEVSPQEVLTSDHGFLKEKCNFILDFVSEYPLQTISFLSADDFIEIKTPLHHAKGYLYDIMIAFQNCPYVDGMKTLHEEKYRPKLKPHFSFRQQLKQHDEMVKCAIPGTIEHIAGSRAFSEDDLDKMTQSVFSCKEVSITSVGESNYALGA